MNIVHIASGVTQGGVGTMLRALILEQATLGENPILVCAAKEQVAFEQWCRERHITVPYYCIENYRLHKMTLWGGLSCKNYQNIVNQFGHTNTVFHFHNPLTCGLLGYIPPQSVCTMHGLIGQITTSSLSNTISFLSLKRLIKKRIQLVGCCQAVADFINKRYHTTQCIGVLNGLGKISKVPSTYIQPNGKIHIGYVSYIDKLKGWRILAQAYQKLSPAARQQCDLNFAGEVAPQDKEYFENFLKQNKEVNYAGYLKEARNNFMPYLDVFVLPSRTEGLPMSILEAMQLGVVPVVTAVGGIPEIIEDGKSGCLIRRDSNHLAEKLTYLISHPQQLAIMKTQTKQRFEQIGTSKRMAEQYMQLYQKLLKDRRN